MSKIKTLADLRKIKENVQSRMDLREKSEDIDNIIQVKVAMATCGIASGAKELMEYFISELHKRRINAIVTQTGCMGYCYAEPTIEVSMPGELPVVYGHVSFNKADEIMEIHIVRGELTDGIIPVNYRTVD